jgi:gamma-glutamyltranspeptidase/glutathione hydrolase
MSVMAGRSRVATSAGIVAASQPLAASAGAQILARGGHAVDAAIAANAVLGVVEPEMNGIGGDLFAIIYDATTRTLHGLNASGWAPSGLTPSALRSHGLQQMPGSGIHSVTVPGVVAGWEALRARFGRLPLADLLAPAIVYAEHGFPVSDIIAARWATWVDKLAAEPEAASTYLVDGRAPQSGEVFTNPDLAKSLRAIAANGRAAFYDGPIADAILVLSRERGGTMTAADLTEFEAEWVAPISTTYRGWTVYELPPNTQGIAALLMLDLMEQFPLRQYGLHSARALHVMIEAKKLAYADMLRYVGDPRFTVVPIGALLDKAYARHRARRIDLTRAASHVEPAVFDRLTTARGDTVYLCAIDRDGNIASLIQSIYAGFGSGLVPPRAGFMLQNRGALFTLAEGRPNTLAPRKRPLHTIIPAFMQKDDVRVGFGIMGAWNQAQAHAQFVANIVDFGPASARDELAAMGHDVEVVPPRTGMFGSGQAVMSNGAGVHFGASEPRHDGAAIPEPVAIQNS